MNRVLCGLLMVLASHTVLAEEIITPAEPFSDNRWRFPPPARRRRRCR